MTMATMRDINDVVTAILHMFGDYADDYDVESIAFEMVDFDSEKDCFVFKPEFDSGSDAFDQNIMNELLMMYEKE